MKLNPKWGSSSLLGLTVLLVSACGSFNTPADVAPSPRILTLEPTSELPAYITLETPSTTTATLAVEVFYLQCRVKTLGFTDGMKPDPYRNSEARLFS
ncbi:hypothetical protein K4A83_22845 [Spirulina subsalsa FACHB-351]|uniref:Uncharacterized protein n=1 Tax=Spirulina subsalsa FACHB-351 TaxID=234711 RepID=A0ABT3LC34_9CYAN|nr:hypothetical protein [Spirulina subsalsa]MCW6039063.1 hypothetical protein [Spirulina subsalsa FACHB-351]